MAGSIVGEVANGVYNKTEASQDATKGQTVNSTSKTEASGGSQYDQDMFLQLLVAEMQYQDPLQPTNNSEYVTQLASFTTIDAIQSVQADMASIQANNLVGKYVIIDDSGNYVSGSVDYVTKDDAGTIQVAVGDKLYDIDKIDSVIDEKYYNAVLSSETFTDFVAKLPSVDTVTLADEENVKNIRALYNSMDAYTKSYIKPEVISKLQAIEAKIAELNKNKQPATEPSGGSSDSKDDSSSDSAAGVTN